MEVIMEVYQDIWSFYLIHYVGEIREISESCLETVSGGMFP